MKKTESCKCKNTHVTAEAPNICTNCKKEPLNWQKTFNQLCDAMIGNKSRACGRKN